MHLSDEEDYSSNPNAGEKEPDRQFTRRVPIIQLEWGDRDIFSVQQNNFADTETLHISNRT